MKLLTVVSLSILFPFPAQLLAAFSNLSNPLPRSRK